LSPSLSVVLLTWNEEANVAACLSALARQTRQDFEVVLVDAASTDRTVQAALDVQPTLPFPLRLVVAERRISVGEARNRGVQLAQAPNIAFLSADTEPSPRWAEMALLRLESADLVYGRQVHAPTEKGVGAAVRGLRYHFPSGAAMDPAKYASHVNAGIRREILLTFPIGTSPGASAVDDILLVKRATAAGYRATYEPRMSVLHRDVDSWRTELRKNRREGLGLGEHAGELGVQTQVLVWAGLMVAALAALALWPGWPTAVLAAFAVWLPALRRAARRAGHMPPGRLVVGVLASPLFDLAFLLAYMRGLLRPSGDRKRAAPGREVDS
jgi:glycosyltransferase involved in cell wall biosynthesis